MDAEQDPAHMLAEIAACRAEIQRLREAIDLKDACIVSLKEALEVLGDHVRPHRG